jgi:uncharacterized membrane protein
MQPSLAVQATHVLLLCALGMALEVVFTAVAEHPSSGDRRLKGYTYLWMAPIYALVYPACALLVPMLAPYPTAVRGVIYMLIIYAVEYSSGWLLRKLVGECPWERGYRDAKWGVHGLIRLDFAPGWIAAGLIFEWAYRVLRGLA